MVGAGIATRSPPHRARIFHIEQMPKDITEDMDGVRAYVQTEEVDVAYTSGRMAGEAMCAEDSDESGTSLDALYDWYSASD